MITFEMYNRNNIEVSRNGKILGTIYHDTKANKWVLMYDSDTKDDEVLFDSLRKSLYQITIEWG